MTTLKKGNLIKNKEGNTYKILEVCGDILFISVFDKHDKYGYTSDEKTLKKAGFTWDTPAWEPSMNEIYWLINTGLAIPEKWTNQSFDRATKDFLGIYQTEELAKAALLEIRRKLGK